MTEKTLEVTPRTADLDDETFLRSVLGELIDDLLSVSHRIHERPETRFQEYFAADLLSTALKDAGFTVDAGIADLDTSFRAEASFGEGGPTLAFICEYDALEKIGHGCGHNIIAAVGLGGALLTKRLLEQDGMLPGRIVVIGTPGEEGGGGKSYMVEAGCFDDLDAALMIHPGGENLSAMSTLGRVALTFEFTGKAAHAAVNPEFGINALDASILTMNAIGLLRQQLPTSARVHAVIEDGGDVPNIIPERSLIRAFVRAPDTGTLLNDLVPRIINCARGAALATGCTVSIDLPTPAYAALNSNPVLGRMIEDNFARIGRKTVPLLTEAFPGSTDMGNVSQVIPVIHPNVEIQPGINMHSHEATEVAGGPNGDKAVLDGALLLALTAAQLFRSESLLTEVKQAFRPGLRIPAQINNLESLRGLM
ncbi:M20 family metallopeptidase [Paenarthrobacter sp.]|uniref:M20 family metallopeptidase n=1 Tax=Paenarthrobacter sp. TaxID=1931993 RepID=UPI002810F97A|nr:M20 family metallopeptidase [Paenarthrobacter sp.]